MTFTAEQLLDDTRLDAGFRRELAAAWSASPDVSEDVWRPRLDEWGLTGPGSAQGLTGLVGVGNSWVSALDHRTALAESAGRFDTTVEELLDRGACGLEFFEKFLPIARTLGFARSDEDLSAWYHRRYDWERGMDLRVLTGDIDRIERAVAVAAGEFEGQRRAANTVRAAWTDDAGAAAAERVGTQLGIQEANLEQLAGLSEALTEAARTLSTAVHAKALSVAALYSPTVQGYTPDRIGQLARIVHLASAGSIGLLDGAIDAASGWFPMLAGASSIPAEEAVGRVQMWLALNFRPEYERRRDEFDAACALCRDSVEEAYRIAGEAARAVVPATGEPPPLFASAPSPAPVAPTPPPAPSSPPTPSPGPASAPTAEAPSGGAPAAARPGSSGGGGSVGGGSVGGGSVGGSNTGSGVAPGVPAAPPVPTQGGTSPFLAPVQQGIVPAPGSIPGFGTLSGLGTPMDSAGISGPGSVLGQIGSIVEPLIEGVKSAIEDVVAGEPAEEPEEEENGDGEGSEGPEGSEDTDEDSGESGDAGSGADTTSSRPELVLEFGGQTWTLATDSERSALTMTSETGEVAHFGLTVGPDGQPRIVPGDEAVPGPDEGPGTPGPGADGAPVAGAPTPVPVQAGPSPSGPPSVVPEPSVIPEPSGSPEVSGAPEPAGARDPQGTTAGGGAADDSGAALAEAGPL